MLENVHGQLETILTLAYVRFLDVTHVPAGAD
jgi:hypothetical protein